MIIINLFYFLLLLHIISNFVSRFLCEDVEYTIKATYNHQLVG